MYGSQGDGRKMRDGRLRNGKIADCVKAGDRRVVYGGKQEAKDNLFGNRDILMKTWERTSGYEVLYNVLSEGARSSLIS
jgi:hypothetical protein